ncbi:sialate O-acetylesterase [Haloferula sp. A504]|uniref:sialate O-acetylesterase n=1 Tax=Haloferula sp. A504 TaxID=3373601 RepID=UPI0031CA90F2|nr:Ig-like domain-containing protein [Verrucomicrobiaceae bacterium E54]
MLRLAAAAAVSPAPALAGINVDFGGAGLYSGEGPAGEAGGTAWNEFKEANGKLADLRDSKGQPTSVSVTVTGFVAPFGFGAGSTQRWADYNFLDDNPNGMRDHMATVVFEGLTPNARYHLYLVGRGDTPDQTATFTLATANGGASGSTRGLLPEGEFGTPGNYVALPANADAAGRLEYTVDNLDSRTAAHNAVQLVEAGNRKLPANPPPRFGSDPVLVDLWGSARTIKLVFSLPLAPGPAIDPANFPVARDGGGPVPLSAAAISGDGRTVTLTTTAPLDLATAFSVKVNDLTDLAGRPLAAATAGTFKTWDNDPHGVKVFILAGQSNMVGYGESEKGHGGVDGAIGSLRHLAVTDAADYGKLLAEPAHPATSAWKTRSDVKVWWDRSEPGSGPSVIKGDLGVGFGTDSAKIGPEYGFGWIVGDHFEDPVLLIKSCWGGRSLGDQFRPPSAVAKRGNTIGPYYTGMLDQVRAVLGNLGSEFPEWAGRGYRIVGIGWHQGWNDKLPPLNAEYEANLVDLINDLRIEFGNPELPVSIATTGMQAAPEYHPVESAQLAVADPAKHPEFKGSVFTTDTRPFWRDASVSPNDQGFHWNFNAESYFLIGKAMGEGMTSQLEDRQQQHKTRQER